MYHGTSNGLPSLVTLYAEIGCRLHEATVNNTAIARKKSINSITRQGTLGDNITALLHLTLYAVMITFAIKLTATRPACLRLVS